MWRSSGHCSSIRNMNCSEESESAEVKFLKMLPTRETSCDSGCSTMRPTLLQYITMSVGIPLLQSSTAQLLLSSHRQQSQYGCLARPYHPCGRAILFILREQEVVAVHTASSNTIMARYLFIDFTSLNDCESTSVSNTMAYPQWPLA